MIISGKILKFCAGQNFSAPAHVSHQICKIQQMVVSTNKNILNHFCINYIISLRALRHIVNVYHKDNSMIDI